MTLLHILFLLSPSALRHIANKAEGLQKIMQLYVNQRSLESQTVHRCANTQAVLSVYMMLQVCVQATGEKGYESRSPLVGSTCPMGATLRPPFKGYRSHRRLRTVTDKNNTVQLILTYLPQNIHIALKWFICNVLPRMFFAVEKFKDILCLTQDWYGDVTRQVREYEHLGAKCGHVRPCSQQFYIAYLLFLYIFPSSFIFF